MTEEMETRVRLLRIKKLICDEVVESTAACCGKLASDDEFNEDQLTAMIAMDGLYNHLTMKFATDPDFAHDFDLSYLHERE